MSQQCVLEAKKGTGAWHALRRVWPADQGGFPLPCSPLVRLYLEHWFRLKRVSYQRESNRGCSDAVGTGASP